MKRYIFHKKLLDLNPFFKTGTNHSKKKKWIDLHFIQIFKEKLIGGKKTFKNSDFSIWPAFKQSPHIKFYRGMYNLTKSEIKQRVHF